MDTPPPPLPPPPLSTHALYDKVNPDRYRNHDEGEYDCDGDGYDDDDDDCTYPSFRDLKLKTLRALYGPNDDDDDDDSVGGNNENDDGGGGTGTGTVTGTETGTSGRRRDRRRAVDKSPKGSLDVSIRPLVHLLNSHPSYATLSSCSGRIALFDPGRYRIDGATESGVDPSEGDGEVNGGGTEVEKGDKEGEDDGACGVGAVGGGGVTNPRQERGRAHGGEARETGTKKRERGSGTPKGRGDWILVSHTPIHPNALVEALGSTDDDDDDDDDAGKAAPPLPRSGLTNPRTHPRPLLLFKMEPLLLHVAASSLRRARALLAIALRLGFRESGIVPTPKRATVAIRGSGLSLSVPLARDGPFRPGDVYLTALAEEANERMVANAERLDRLTKEVERQLFSCKQGHEKGKRLDWGTSEMEAIATSAEEKLECRTKHGGAMKQGRDEQERYSASFRTLPDLNLWGHAAVAVPIPYPPTLAKMTTDTEEDVDVFVFGGYGVGPIDRDNDDDAKRATPRRGKGSGGAARSDGIFVLSRRGGTWSDRWTRRVSSPTTNPSEEADSAAAEVPPSPVCLAKETCVAGLRLRATSLGPREGHAACLIPPLANNDDDTHRTPPPLPPFCASEPMVALFGGRQGPARPLGDLLLYPPAASAGTTMWSPPDVRGSSPSSRWGHTFTSLPHPGEWETMGGTKLLAVVAGGRDDSGALSSAYVLSFVEESLPSSDDEHNDDKDDDSKTARRKCLRIPPITGRAYVRCFQWQKLDDMLVPRFHHAATHVRGCASTADDRCMHGFDKLFVFGGCTDVSDILEHFTYELERSDDPTTVVPRMIALEMCRESAWHRWDRRVGDNGDALPSLIGAAACSLMPASREPQGGNLVCVSGGVQGDGGQPLTLFRWDGTGSLRNSISVSIQSMHSSSGGRVNQPSPDLGNMVHHCALPLSDTSLLLIGGGSPSFAFGPSFARCWEVSLCRSNVSSWPLAGMGKVVESRDTDAADLVGTRRRRDDDKRGANRSKRETGVIFVPCSKAKEVKVGLESVSLIDKTFRMAKATSSTHLHVVTSEEIIAIPVKSSLLKMMESSADSGDFSHLHPWMASVLAAGHQEMPFSSTVLGQRKQRLNRP